MSNRRGQRINHEHTIPNETRCQHYGCKRTWRARMYQCGRCVFLCGDCANYLEALRSRDRANQSNSGDSYVRGSCNREVVTVY